MTGHCRLCGIETQRDSDTALCEDCAEVACEFLQTLPPGPDPCDDDCPGVLVSSTNGRQYGDGEEIQKCDQCERFKSDLAAFRAIEADLRAFRDRKLSDRAGAEF